MDMEATQRLQDAERQCATEPIHRLGRVQSHGALVVCDIDGGRIRYCSANTAEVLALPPDALVGRGLGTIDSALPDLAARVARQPSWPDGTPRRAKRRLTLGPSARPLDATAHQWDGHLVVEFQPSIPDQEIQQQEQDPIHLVDHLSHRLGLAGDVLELCGIACTEIQTITGYQRVLAYEFDADWNGVVIAECTRDGEPSKYLGLHFPASDIPPQARALYHAVPLRVIADAADEGCPLVGAPGDPATPDLSHALLRSVSPMHLQYLRNMGVQATIAISLLVDGRLWGLIVAHDDRPRIPPHHVVHALRVSCRVLGQMASARLLALEYRKLQIDDRALLNLIERIPLVAATHPGPREVWRVLRDDIVAWFQADGAALVHRGETLSTGSPDGTLAEACIPALAGRHPNAVFATTSLLREGLVAEGSPVAGALWIPIPIPGHALLLWRREIRRDVYWGGDPTKRMDLGPDGDRLGPRRSFAKWQETRRDESLPWTPVHLEGARRIAAQWRLLVMDEERRQAETTVRLLEAGILRIHDGFVIARVDDSAGLVVVFANPLFDAMLHAGGASTGTRPAFLDATVVEKEAVAVIRAAIERREPANVEFRTLDGRWMELALTPIDGALATGGHWAAILRDVGGRKRDEALKDEQARALQEANDRYARILETSHEGILTLNEQGVVDYCNQRMLDILGVAPPLAGRSFAELFTDPDDARDVLGPRGARSTVTHLEAHLRHGSGRGVACDIALIPLRQRAKERSGWLAMVSDVSDRKALENSLMLVNASLEATIAERTAQLVSAKESADEANRAKSEFLANMSHELRSPLHGILGFTRLLIDDEVPAERRSDYLRKVERNASNLLALVNDLLDSAKIESQSFSIQRSRCDLADIVRGVASEFQVEGSTTSPIKLLLPPAAPCHGDPFRLAQVIRNLVANAVRFAPAGSRIDVGIERADGGWLVAVRDRGPGIPEGELESIFERFSQSSKTKTGAGGTGLGLHIARGIVRSHGGWLKAENREGGGACFKVFLPDPP